jgi:cyclopropane fatty-acyl-phospholipid synthase-like methyltransferase
VPHPLIRWGIRQNCAQRLRDLGTLRSLAERYASKMHYVDALRTRPIAIETTKANEQHYEVGTGVLVGMLGPRMKYSSCLYALPFSPRGRTGGTLAEAEERMLELYCQRAELGPGISILDLGCGWGSGAIYFAEKYPTSSITAFSNSRTQKAHIEAVAADKKLTNLTVITGDVVDHDFDPDKYDRVVSIELFEHMKNYEALMAKIARALKPGGKLFVHIFCHRDAPYDYDEGWMTQFFFTGGTMPSADLLLFFQRDLVVERQWWVNGRHYARTCEDWLKLMMRNKKAIWPHLEETYGKGEASKWYYRWEIFYMAVSLMFPGLRGCLLGPG